MLRRSFLALALFNSFACSGYDSDLDGAEFGQLEQSITVKVSPAFQHGVTTAASRAACSRRKGASASQDNNIFDTPLHTPRWLPSGCGGGPRAA
jgi:hypothetical protein